MQKCLHNTGSWLLVWIMLLLGSTSAFCWKTKQIKKKSFKKHGLHIAWHLWRGCTRLSASNCTCYDINQWPRAFLFQLQMWRHRELSTKLQLYTSELESDENFASIMFSTNIVNSKTLSLVNTIFAIYKWMQWLFFSFCLFKQKVYYSKLTSQVCISSCSITDAKKLNVKRS